MDEAVTGVGRDLLIELLGAEKVVAKPYFSPACHEVEPYRSRAQPRLPHTERLASQVIALPTGTSVSRESIRRVCDVIRLTVSRGTEVTARHQRMKGPR